jgi:hypothetical protein
MAEEALSGMARYTKGDIVGEGTFGVVYKATDKLVRGARSHSLPWLCP